MRPTRKALVLAACGLPIALLPAVADPRLWVIWPVFLCALALVLGCDALLAPRAPQVAATLDMPALLPDGSPSTLSVNPVIARRIELGTGEFPAPPSETLSSGEVLPSADEGGQPGGPSEDDEHEGARW